MSDLRHLPDRVTLRKLQRDAFGSPSVLSSTAAVPALVQVRQVHDMQPDGGELRHEGKVLLDRAAIDPAWPDWEIVHGSHRYGVEGIGIPAEVRQGMQSHVEVTVR